MLQYRASGTDKFYLVTKADQTVSVFKDIGTSPSKLRVARRPKPLRQTKKPGWFSRAFDSRSSKNYWAAGVNFDTTVSTGLNACLARSL
ncbi:hypothetical protein ABIA96_002911 [Bradyrhizobium sp. LB11.1]